MLLSNALGAKKQHVIDRKEQGSYVSETGAGGEISRHLPASGTTLG